MKDHGKARRFFAYTALIILLLFFLLPLFYMISISLNPDEADILKSMATIQAFVPDKISLQNYLDVFIRIRFARHLFNSLLIVGTTVLGGLLVNSMAGFALARFSWRGGAFLIGLIAALMIIPFEAIAVPLLLITNKFGWLDSYQVQIIPFIASPFYIFLFYQFFLRFPVEIEEAALIDGSGWYGIYWRMALPLAKPVLSSVAILHFLVQWGQFLWPLMTTRGADYRPLTVAMQVYFGQYPRYWGDIMAFATMMTIPVLTLFVFLQKFYVTSVARYGGK